MMDDTKPKAYGNLCSLFYDAKKGYAPEREVDFYASFIERNPGRVLEAMVGSGRLLIPLMQRGFVVDGVDNSVIMLNRCRQRCAEFQVAPELYEQSLETLSLPHRYAVVTIAVGSFQLICDRAQALQALKKLHAHMLYNAQLLIDIFVPDFSQEKRSISVARINSRTVVRLTKRHVFDEALKRAYAFCHYELLVDGLVLQSEDELIEVSWYTDEEWVKLLEEAGFTVIAFYDEIFRRSGPSRVLQARPKVNLRY